MDISTAVGITGTAASIGAAIIGIIIFLQGSRSLYAPLSQTSTSSLPVQQESLPYQTSSAGFALPPSFSISRLEAIYRKAKSMGIAMVLAVLIPLSWIAIWLYWQLISQTVYVGIMNTFGPYIVYPPQTFSEWLSGMISTLTLGFFYLYIPYAVLSRIGPPLKKGVENRAVRKETQGLFKNTIELKEDIEHAKVQARRSRITY